jgi:hypothetical protein
MQYLIRLLGTWLFFVKRWTRGKLRRKKENKCGNRFIVASSLFIEKMGCAAMVFIYVLIHDYANS